MLLIYTKAQPPKVQVFSKIVSFITSLLCYIIVLVIAFLCFSDFPIIFAEGAADLPCVVKIENLHMTENIVIAKTLLVVFQVYIVLNVRQR